MLTMKNLYLILFISLLNSVSATAQNVLTEDFMFGPIDSIDNSNDWLRSGVNFKYNIKVVSPGLDYPGYIGSGRGNTCQLSNAGEGDVAYKNLSSPITTGAAYMSFMLQVDSLPSTVTDGYCIAFNPNTGGTNLNTALHVKRLSNSTFNLGIRKSNDIDYSNAIYQTGTTYLVVLKYSIINGSANDSSNLYVFVTGVPGTEPILPDASMTEGDDYTGQASVHLVNNYAQSGLEGSDIKIDGIRVGTSWETSVLAELTSVSDQISKKLLNMNFPNPFRQKTTIKYQIPSRGLVGINICNGSGHCIELLHEIQDEGEHELEWEDDKIPAGVYTCSIQFNGNIVINQLVRI
jgi:hypothetical protein